MIIVKSRKELMRFALFLALVALLVWFVTGRVDLWRTSEQPGKGSLPAAGQTGQKPQGLKENAPAPAMGAIDLDLSEGRDYFAEYRIDRERLRGALGEQLKELMNSQSAAEEVRRQASQEYLQLGQTASLEGRAEAMVKARGFEDVIVHLANGSAQVVVKASALSQQQVLQVMDTVSRITGVKSSAITVLPKYR